MRNALARYPMMSLGMAVTLGLLVWGFWPQPVLVEAIQAERAQLTVTIEEEGRTRVIDRYVIAAPVDGVACRVELDVGDPVIQDEVLLSIAPLESQVLDPRSRAQAEAQVAAAESSLHAAGEQAHAAVAAQELAASELKRLRPLADKGVISEDAYDAAATEAKTTTAARRSADFKVDVARYELQAARTVLEYTAGSGGEPAERVPVRAPISGRILKLEHECEGPVRTGDPLFEIGDPAKLEIEVDVLSIDAVKIKPGTRVLFERWGGDTPLEGVVRVVEPIGFTKVSALGVEEQRVLIISDFTSPAEYWQRLGDGYRVEARFILWQDENVLQVPAGSLFRYDDKWAVFVVENQRASRRTVEIGQRNGLAAEILDGIADGEWVINHPSDEVDDGRRVKVRGLH